MILKGKKKDKEYYGMKKMKEKEDDQPYFGRKGAKYFPSIPLG